MTDEHGKLDSDMSLYRVLATVYGPYAFSLISLLIIWIWIVQPQLALQSLDFKAQQEIVDKLQELSASHRNMADVMLRASTSMEIVSERLQKIDIKHD